MYVWPSQLNQHAKPGACSIEEVVIHIIQYIFIYIYIIIIIIIIIYV